MLIVRNNIIPFSGYKAINICGILFCRKNAVLKDVDIRHESIHAAQIYETLILFFYIWYIVEFLIKLVLYWDWDKAYKNMSFEREAYDNEDDEKYLDNRKLYAWFKRLVS